ncbi:trypsin-like peptidase domain-containing protein [Streptomyces massasporeus]|uniref:trypsin-like peptidase domain-containing protein n=1 Tax=Streptomyces massasporeus TaxID=67324 RepID=UPI00367EBCD0
METLGSGFFVAPGWVLTCAHVVKDSRSIRIIGEPPLNTPVPVEVKARLGKPIDGKALWLYPDIALLELQEEIAHPSVKLESKMPISDEPCHAFGYAQREYGVEPGGSPATFRFEGLEADGFLRLKEGAAEPGLSGAPLVSPGRAAVVGMIVATRGPSTDLGGWATPIVPPLASELKEFGALGQEIVERSSTAVQSNPSMWDDVFRYDQPAMQVAEWEAQLQDAGICIWTNRDIEIGHTTGPDSLSPDDVSRRGLLNVADLRQGRLPNLQQPFPNLGSALDQWLTATPWNDFSDSIRVLWIVGEQGNHRSRALLSCLARAGWHGYRIYDAIHDLGRVAKAVNRPAMSHFAIGVIGVDLQARQDSNVWNDVRNAVDQFRTRTTDRDQYPLIVASGTEEQAQAAHEALNSLLEITTVDTAGRPAKRIPSHPDAVPMTQSRLTNEHYYNRGLPMTARKLFGRSKELGELRSAWQSDRTRIFTVVASGGTGKSALINTWLGEMRAADFKDAQKVLAWSFYSQGTKDNLVSADPFVEFASNWLGGTSTERSLSPWEKGLQLASLIKDHVFLLVLDGVEPLQYPLTAPDVGGQFTDDSIRALLEELAKPDWQGLCVITTRVSVTDLSPFQERNIGTVIEKDLRNLDEYASTELLRHLVGGEWEFAQLQPIVKDVGCHALAVTLLGNYLRDVHQGDITCRFDLERLTIDEREGGHARRVMASYVRWLNQHERVAELAVLLMIGLFDRPAPPEAIGVLLAQPAMKPAYTELGRVGSDEWNRCVGALRSMGLLNREIPDWPGSVDAHPLIREHFRVLLQQEPSVWVEGNRRLFEYYRSLAPGLPSESQGMARLYSAVNHGCAAGLYAEVFEQVLLRRVWRDHRMSFSTRRLGMVGSDLVALSNFFEHRWTELRDVPLDERARTLLMTNAGVRLRQLGRLSDARQCFGSVVRDIRPTPTYPEEMEDASYAAAQYCELLVIAGRLTAPASSAADSALASGQTAVRYAGLGREPYFKMHARSSLAEAHFMLGQTTEAERLFEEARKIDHDDHPRPPFLYSQSLFRYGYFLIETDRVDRVLAWTESDAGWGTNGQDSSLLSKAIRLLVLGAARLRLMERSDQNADFVNRTREILDEAVAKFRTAGYADYTVRGLVERARFHRVRHRIEDEDFVRAQEDLSKAAFEAGRGKMDLLRADIMLERAACCCHFMEVMTVQERDVTRQLLQGLLEEAGQLISAMQYGRRSGWLKELSELAA